MKYIKKVYSLCILLAGFSIIFATEIYNDSWAVIVGIEKYTGEGIKELNYAVDDAEAIRKVLIEQHNVNPDNINLLLNDDATKTNIQRGLLDYYKNSNPEDRIIFYFFLSNSIRLIRFYLVCNRSQILQMVLIPFLAF